ncbi:hypothetical protein FEP96_05455 [Burkholderia multivorans]|nr:hypothetical protein [Burkholderia multivorans]
MTVPFACPTIVPFSVASRPAVSVASPTALVLAPSDRSRPVAISSLPPLLIPPVAFRLPCCATSAASPTDSIAPLTATFRCAVTPTVEPLATLPPIATSFCASAVIAPAAATEPSMRRSPAPVAGFAPFARSAIVPVDSTLFTATLPAAVTLTDCPWISPCCATSRAASSIACCANVSVPAPTMSRAALTMPCPCPASVPVTLTSRPAASAVSRDTVVVPPRSMSLPARASSAPLLAIAPVDAMLPALASSDVLPADCSEPPMSILRAALSATSAPPVTAPVTLRSFAAPSTSADAACTSCSVADPPAAVVTFAPRSEPVRFVSPPELTFAASPNATAAAPPIAPPALSVPLPCATTEPFIVRSRPASTLRLPSDDVDCVPRSTDCAALTVRLPPDWIVPVLVSDPAAFVSVTSPFD